MPQIVHNELGIFIMIRFAENVLAYTEGYEQQGFEQCNMIIALRSRLIHGYLGIDIDTLWSIIRDDVPSLLDDLRGVKAAVDAGEI